MFSPYYARARRNGTGDPLDHCALNVALYGQGGKRWALTERRRAAVHRAKSSLAIGPSTVSWEGGVLTIRFDEVTFPLPGRLRGTVRLHPQSMPGLAVPLDAAGRHRWSPVAPVARVEVTLSRPQLAWAGSGYLDANDGDAPLERAFAGWHWSRASVRNGTVIQYDVADRNGGARALALACDRSGGIRSLPTSPVAILPRTGWRIARTTRADAGTAATVVATLEDTPFYVRSLVSAQIRGERATAVHESLSLDRFSAGWVRALLPFRMPRAWR